MLAGGAGGQWSARGGQGANRAVRHDPHGPPDARDGRAHGHQSHPRVGRPRGGHSHLRLDCGRAHPRQGESGRHGTHGLLDQAHRLAGPLGSNQPCDAKQEQLARRRRRLPLAGLTTSVV